MNRITYLFKRRRNRALDRNKVRYWRIFYMSEDIKSNGASQLIEIQ